MRIKIKRKKKKEKNKEYNREKIDCLEQPGIRDQKSEVRNQMLKIFMN